jgi:D-alanyl-D-alanine carboxypeptidase/LysM domain
MTYTRVGRNGVLAALAATFFAFLACASASAAAPHVVASGETLWSISAANNLTTRTVAVYNGVPEDAALIEGTTIQVPTVEEGAAALATGTAAGSPPATAGSGDTTAAPTTTDSIAPAPSGEVASAPGMGHVPSPWGELHLAPAAADAWNAMRQESLEVYGVDLYPGGTASAYRTYEQQAELYSSYLSGTGSPANPPGSSSHEYGTAVDVETPEMRWVIDQIGWKYGWGKVHGPDEWWHVDYVGG